MPYLGTISQEGAQISQNTAQTVAMPRGDHHSARIRAARAFADLDRIELGKRIGFSKETVSRLESGERGADDPVLLGKIAAACGVPAEFMALGFAPLERPLTDVEQRLYELEQETHKLGDPRRLYALMRGIEANPQLAREVFEEGKKPFDADAFIRAAEGADALDVAGEEAVQAAEDGPLDTSQEDDGSSKATRAHEK
jgi:transcriptional regulator with XRE-family HTH domain